MEAKLSTSGGLSAHRKLLQATPIDSKFPEEGSARCAARYAAALIGARISPHRPTPLASSSSNGPATWFYPHPHIMKQGTADCPAWFGAKRRLSCLHIHRASAQSLHFISPGRPLAGM